jgi:hypothetical protein
MRILISAGNALGVCAAAAIIAIGTPSMARAEVASTAMYGAGPHGYDWEIGTWSCTNDSPSAESGPADQTLTVTKTSSGALLFHTTGTNFDFTSYNTYVPSIKMWLSPYSGADGTYGNESTSQTGKKVVWVGSTHFADSGKTMPTRDTYVNSPNKYTDLGEFSSGGVWKKQYNMTCTKT